MTRVLIIEDNPHDAIVFQNLVEREGYAVEVANSGEEGLARAQSGEFDVVLTDLHLGGQKPREGHDVVSQLHTANPHLPVILMTGVHTAEAAIDAIKLGAFDYFAKPVDVSSEGFRADFAAMIDTASISKRLMAKVQFPGARSSGPKSVGDQMVGKSRPMLNVYKEIGRIAPTPATVLIRGETGTGKELVARALWSHSQRVNQPFIVVNCAAIPENLLENELFGHEAGAFTGAKTRRLGRFELAQDGTIFLDEIGDMDIKLQQKLLRVLQEGTIERVGGTNPIPVDVRVLAATHRDLEGAVKAGEFRQDLYFRLNIAMISLPPLRDRKEDIPDLINYFLDRYGPELGRSSRPVSDAAKQKLQEAIRFLQEQSWPGNVRELRSVVRKSLLLAHGYAITEEIVSKALVQNRPPSTAAQQPFDKHVADVLAAAKAGERACVFSELVEVVERELYTETIRRAKGDQTKAITWLGISRPTLREKLTRYEVSPRPASKG